MKASLEGLALLWSAAWHLVRARLALAFLPWPRASRAPAPASVSVRHAAADVAWAVQAVARRFPGTRCLHRALALRAMLHRAGHAAELQLGVARSSKELAAHAWVTCGAHTFDCGEDPARYAAFPAGRG